MTADIPATGTTRVGVLSDTHGATDRRVLAVFEGVDFILHAGDIGSAGVLGELEALAPVTAVLGNTDHEILPYRLDKQACVRIAGKRFLVIHKLKHLGQIPEGVDIVVHGHTHSADIDERDGTLIVNPGWAHEPYGDSSGSVAILVVDGGKVAAEIVPLDRKGSETK